MTISAGTDRIEVVLFDVGGVLVELAGTRELTAWTDGVLDDEVLWHWWLSSPAVRAFETGGCTPDEFADAVIEGLALPVGRATFLNAFASWPTGPMPGVKALLDELPVTLTRATLSNTNHLHWPRIMDEMGFSTRFHAHFPSHVTGHIKPDAECYQHAADSLARRPAEILFLDDNQINIDAARSIGMNAHRTRGTAETRNILETLGLLSVR